MMVKEKVGWRNTWR